MEGISSSSGCLSGLKPGGWAKLSEFFIGRALSGCPEEKCTPKFGRLTPPYTAPMARRHWYYQKIDGKRHGPFSSRRMKKLARQGHLEPRDRVWKAGSPAIFLAADVPQLYLRVPTHRTWLHTLKTLGLIAACFLAAAVTSPWSYLSLALWPPARPWLTGLSIASLAAAILAGGIGFLTLDATYLMIPPTCSRPRRPQERRKPVRPPGRG